MASLSLTLIEIIVLMLGAITLGITIHFFIVSRRSLKTTTLQASGKVNRDLEDWKLRYFNDIESRDKELGSLRKKLLDTEENNDINTIEAEESRKRNKELLAEMEELRKSAMARPETNVANSLPVQTITDKGPYIEQLREAQQHLLAHNERINTLLNQIDLVKDAEDRQLALERNNEELRKQIEDLRFIISQKEKELSHTRQKENLTSEMTSRLDSAYNEFNVLQDKIYKLESQVNVSKLTSLDYEDLKESHQNIVRDYEEQKLRYNALLTESQQLQASLDDVEDKLKEANFQRQQLHKKVNYLEELNNDMQAVADANKKLEGQLKRIGELESMLNVVAEERDELTRKQINA